VPSSDFRRRHVSVSIQCAIYPNAKLVDYLHEYIAAAGIAEQKKGLLFRRSEFPNDGGKIAEVDEYYHEPS
jgi:hypothetical protein